MTTKLTLSVDREVVKRAKRFAAKHGTSVSTLVTQFLDALSRPLPDTEVPPVLGRLRGRMKGVEVEDYRLYLGRKYK